MKKGNGFLIIIAIVGIIFAFIILRSPEQDKITANTASTASDDLLYKNAQEKIGPDNAKVKIVVFSDYQCPYCKTTHENLNKILSEKKDDVQVIHRNLIVHPTAEILAKAAEAASLQGKFKEMNDLIWSKQAQANEEYVIGLAKEIGLDVEKFKTDLNGDQVKDILKKDDDDAGKLKLKGTPSIFINGTELANPAVLEEEVNGSL